LDLKPHQTKGDLLKKINGKPSTSFAKALKLDKVQLALVKAFTSKEQFQNAEILVNLIKAIPIQVTALRPIEESISTVGGLEISELNTDFSLKSHPHLYCIGEMINWDAPTGGFLLQGCFSMGYHAGNSIQSKLNSTT